MTSMISGNFPGHFSAAGFQPVGGGEADGLAGLHGGQAGEHVLKVFLGVDAKATAVFHNGVEDGGFLPGFFAADEQPVLCPEFGRANGVLDRGGRSGAGSSRRVWAIVL